MIVLVLRPVLDCGLTCIFTLRSGPRICCSAVGPRKSLPAIGLGAQSGAALQGRGVLFGTSVSRYKRLGGTRLNAIGQRCRSVSCARSMTKLRYPTLASPRPLYISQLGARHLFPLSLIEGRPTTPRPAAYLKYQTKCSFHQRRTSPRAISPSPLPSPPKAREEAREEVGPGRAIRRSTTSPSCSLACSYSTLSTCSHSSSVAAESGSETRFRRLPVSLHLPRNRVACKVAEILCVRYNGHCSG